jgi:membrane-associated protease RseP (regulator of RpoE activity)
MNSRNTNPWVYIAILISFLLPWLVLFVGGSAFGTLWFWIVLVICWVMIWLLTSPAGPTSAAIAPGLRMLYQDEQPQIIREVMDVRVALDENGVRVFRGPLRIPASSAYEKLQSALGGQSVPLVQEDEQLGANIVLMPRPAEERVEERPVRPLVHWILFALTVLTTTWAGATHQGVNILRDPSGITVGLPYSIGLLLILGVHELGHYFMARKYEMNVTPPFFIPVPFALGTFGAFIQMRSPPSNRRVLFDVAIAGPLAGLAVAIPALWLGLKHSAIVAHDATSAPALLSGTVVGSSVLFSILAKLSLGPLVDYGTVVRLGPLAFAGWLGFFVTALNLLPVGQLDGGHIARAMFGARAGETISSVAMWSMFLLALFVWPGLMLWVLIIFFLAGRGTPPLNDVTRLSFGRRLLGYGAFAILVMILAPVPRSWWETAGSLCPYL